MDWFVIVALILLLLYTLIPVQTDEVRNEVER